MLSDPGTAERVANVGEQMDEVDRRQIVADVAREVAERSAQLNARLRVQ